MQMLKVPPPDSSFPDKDKLEDWRVLNFMSMPPSGESMTQLRFIPFKVNPWDVSRLVHRWVESWYRVPGDFADRAVVPHRFARVLVPFIVYKVDIKLFIIGTETYNPPKEEPGKTQQYGLYKKPDEPKIKTISEYHSYSDTYPECSATSSTDRGWYDSWGNKMYHLPKCAFNPDTDFGLLAPLDLCDTVELEHMCDLVHAEQEKKKEGFFQSLWSSVKSAFSDSDTALSAPPSDAYMLPSLSEKDSWDVFGHGIKMSMINRCTRDWERRADLYYHRSVKDYEIQSFSHYSPRIYIPVYSGTYTYGNTEYRVIVNGHNGEIDGVTPKGSFGGFFHNVFRHMGFG